MKVRVPTSQSGYTYGKEQGLPAAGPSMVVQGKVLAVCRVAWLSSLNMVSLLAVCCCTQALASPAPTAPACSWSSTPEFWSKMYFLQKVREGNRITPVSVSVTCSGGCISELGTSSSGGRVMFMMCFMSDLQVGFPL